MARSGSAAKRSIKTYYIAEFIRPVPDIFFNNQVLGECPALEGTSRINLPSISRSDSRRTSSVGTFEIVYTIVTTISRDLSALLRFSNSRYNTGLIQCFSEAVETGSPNDYR
jgi:hypothetical protein